MTCTCGIPNKANYYVNVTLGRDIPGGTETTETDIYVCDDHMPERLTRSAVRSLLRWDGHEEWEILESKKTNLR